ncbi:MAG: NapC/NirT family cytochrome c [Campylobacteraceae bacterium]
MKSKKLIVVLLILVGCVIGVLLSGLGVVVAHKTSSESYCISCHTQHSLIPENPTFSHFNNRAGVTVKCGDCHIGQGVGNYVKAKLGGLKDAVTYMTTRDFDTKEWMDKNREELADKALRDIANSNSQVCVTCHAKIETDNLPSNMDPLAREVHAYNNAKPDSEQKQCIYCHRGVAHEYKKEWAAGHTLSLQTK